VKELEAEELEAQVAVYFPFQTFVRFSQLVVNFTRPLHHKNSENKQFHHLTSL
jgi:hypothetical protein